MSGFLPIILQFEFCPSILSCPSFKFRWSVVFCLAHLSFDQFNIFRKAFPHTNPRLLAQFYCKMAKYFTLTLLFLHRESWNPLL